MASNNRPPRLLTDIPFTWVTSELQGDVHLFVPESFPRGFVQLVAINFSRLVQQRVMVFHDRLRSKVRMCPIPSGVVTDISSFGAFMFDCDATQTQAANAEEVEEPPSVEDEQAMTSEDEEMTTSENEEVTTSEDAEPERHIPRPRNRWILYRQAVSHEITESVPNVTPAEISTIASKRWKEELPHIKAYWQAMAEEEDRRHKEMYPGYKFTAKKTATKATPT